MIIANQPGCLGIAALGKGGFEPKSRRPWCDPGRLSSFSDGRSQMLQFPMENKTEEMTGKEFLKGSRTEERRRRFPDWDGRIIIHQWQRRLRWLSVRPRIRGARVRIPRQVFFDVSVFSLISLCYTKASLSWALKYLSADQSEEYL